MMTTDIIIIIAYILVFLGIAFLIFNYLNRSALSNKKNNHKSLSDEFKGKKVIFDGHFNVLRKREIKEQLTNWNVEVEHKMSRKTGILITGKNPDELVIEEAKNFGLKIYSDDSFMALNQAKEYKAVKGSQYMDNKTTVKIEK